MKVWYYENENYLDQKGSWRQSQKIRSLKEGLVVGLGRTYEEFGISDQSER